MNNEIKSVIEEAVAPLKQEIEAIKAQLAALAPVAALAKAMEPPAMVKEAQAILSGIPKETLAALGVVDACFDPQSIWFRLQRQNGATISVKRTENGFRVRHRDKTGRLFKTLTPSLNGLVGALKSLV